MTSLEVTSLAILSEAYSYLDYKGRIFATKDFVSGLLDYVTENSAAIHQLLDAVDEELVNAAKTEPARVTISLRISMSSRSTRNASSVAPASAWVFVAAPDQFGHRRPIEEEFVAHFEADLMRYQRGSRFSSRRTLPSRRVI